MSTFWKAGGGAESDAVSPVAGEGALSAEAAESILNELASAYLNDEDIARSLGAVHHLVQGFDQSSVSDAHLPNLEAKYRA